MIAMLPCKRLEHITHSLKQQYAVTDVRYDILKLYGMAKAGCWEEIRQLYAVRKNIIPIEVLLFMVFDLVLFTSGSYAKSI